MTTVSNARSMDGYFRRKPVNAHEYRTTTGPYPSRQKCPSGRWWNEISTSMYGIIVMGSNPSGRCRSWTRSPTANGRMAVGPSTRSCVIVRRFLRMGPISLI
ncbi:unnamed protein product [Nippostrongylus brasiliensis]|uniref:Uncharacterized protein n=1 Tax=Nippostrongylus brasiliensis TaxID=27835 RepID=A0A0N4YZU6_NIPBR|nr:unnamed protein product [Nippostrongylus brasiliensis]